MALLRRFRKEVESGVPLSQGEMAFDGRDLISMGLKPGPRFGEILASLMDRVLDDPSLNDAATLREIVQGWLDNGEASG